MTDSYCITELLNWADKWGMLFNIKKCKVMHIGRSNPLYTYYMNGEPLLVVDDEKDIGIHIHKSLKPSVQCARAAQTANVVLGQISRSFHFRDKKFFLNLYKQHVRCHLEFSVPVWSPWSVADKEIIEKVQIRAVNMISGLKGVSYNDKLQELKLQSLETRRKRFDLIQVFKIINNYDRVDSKTWFKTVEETTGVRLTRNLSYPKNLIVNRVHSDVRKYFFSQRVVTWWNELPNEVKDARSINIFKHKLDKLFL